MIPIADRPAAQARVEHLRQSSSEIEVCSSRQSLQLFARGEGLWRELPRRERRRQLERMASEVDRLYPSYRWFLYDARETYAAPYTVFGQKRAALSWLPTRWPAITFRATGRLSET